MWEIHCRTKQTGRNLYLFAPVAFAMKVAALHLWSIFTPKSGANAKEREGRMHFGVAQRFAALIAGVKQTSLKLSAKASAGLPRSVRGYAGLWRGIASQGQGDTDLWRGMVSERGGGGGRAMYRASRVHLLSGSWRTSRRLCFVSERTVGSKRFAFGELAHIKGHAALWRGMVSERGGVRAMYRAPCIHSLSGSWPHRGACVLRPSVR